MADRYKDIGNILGNFIHGFRQGIIITDKNGLVTWVNKSIQTTTGYSFDEFIGKTPGEVLQGKETNPLTVEEIRKGLRKGELVEVEILNYDKFGNKMWLDLQIFPVVNDENEITDFISIQHDISKLKEKNEKLESFNHIVSHNLINQVNNIHSLTRILSKYVTEGQKKYLTLLNISSNKLLETVSGLKSLLTIEKEGIDLQLELIPIKDFILKVTEGVLIGNSSVSITVDDESLGESDAILTNAAYLESIVHNLLTNAIKYRHPDRAIKIVVKVQKIVNQIVIRVIDNGLGIDMEKAGDHIFKIFQTFHDNQDSVGVGLYLSKKQAEELGGDLSVESQVGEGSVFSLTLPFQES